MTSSLLGIVECHPKIIVFLASVECHLASSVFKIIIVLFLQLLNQFVVELWVDMADLAVINMPAYSLMVVVNHAVGNAWIMVP